MQGTVGCKMVGLKKWLSDNIVVLGCIFWKVFCVDSCCFMLLVGAFCCVSKYMCVSDDFASGLQYPTLRPLIHQNVEDTKKFYCTEH